MGESLKKRDEIRPEDTWDLGAMMPSDQVWEELLRGRRTDWRHTEVSRGK